MAANNRNLSDLVGELKIDNIDISKDTEMIHKSPVDEAIATLSRKIIRTEDQLSSIYFKSLKELEKWYVKTKKRPNKLEMFRVSREIYANYKSIDIGKTEYRPKILVCHDYQGNYLPNEDLNPLGYFPHPNGKRYHLQFPQLIDQFIYFSHYRIAVPPVNWINFCHKNDIQCFGCIIIEGDSGKAALDELIAKDKNDEFKYVDMLVFLAEFYRFDGFLINIETSFGYGNETAKNDQLVVFIELLRAKLHNRINGSKLIWYDALIPSLNRVKYINGINEENFYLLDKSDWFFTNYWWTEQHLKRNLKSIGELASREKLFVGCDVWGRGSPLSSGGFTIPWLINYIKNYVSNVALFAPAWTLEYYGMDNFAENDTRFWIGNSDSTGYENQGISTYVSSRNLPVRYVDGGFQFYTNFSKGEGSFFNVLGISQSQNNWVNGNYQSYIPILTYEKQPESSINVTLNDQDAFYGGHCLKVRHKDNDNIKPITFFKLHTDCPKSHIRISFTYKYLQYNFNFRGHFEVEIKYHIERRKKSISIPLNSSFRFKLPFTSESNKTWNTLTQVISTPKRFAGEICVIDDISINFVNEIEKEWILITSPNVRDCLNEFLIGELSIENLEVISVNSESNGVKKVKTTLFENYNRQFNIIEWNNDENIDYWIVYLNGNFKGTTSNPCYYLDRTDFSDSMLIRIDSVTRMGQLIKGDLISVEL